MSKDFIKHDQNADNDSKIIELNSIHGLAGDGFYWKFICFLSNQTNYKFPAEKMSILTGKFNTKIEVLNAILNSCLEIGLLKLDENNDVFSERLILDREELANLKHKLSESGKLGSKVKKNKPPLQPPLQPPLNPNSSPPRHITKLNLTKSNLIKSNQSNQSNDASVSQSPVIETFVGENSNENFAQNHALFRQPNSVGLSEADFSNDFCKDFYKNIKQNFNTGKEKQDAVSVGDLVGSFPVCSN